MAQLRRHKDMHIIQKSHLIIYHIQALNIAASKQKKRQPVSLTIHSAQQLLFYI